MYKKLLAITLTLMLTLSIGGVTLAADTTLDFTDGFDTEDSLTSWSLYGGGVTEETIKPVIDTENVQTGTGALKIGGKTSEEDTNTYYQALYKTVENLEPGATYEAYVFFKNGVAGKNFRLAFSPQAWTSQSEQYVFANNSALTTEWTKMSIS